MSDFSQLLATIGGALSAQGIGGSKGLQQFVASLSKRQSEAANRDFSREQSERNRAFTFTRDRRQHAYNLELEGKRQEATLKKDNEQKEKHVGAMYNMWMGDENAKSAVNKQLRLVLPFLSDPATIINEENISGFLGQAYDTGYSVQQATEGTQEEATFAATHAQRSPNTPVPTTSAERIAEGLKFTKDSGRLTSAENSSHVLQKTSRDINGKIIQGVNSKNLPGYLDMITKFGKDKAAPHFKNSEVVAGSDFNQAGTEYFNRANALISSDKQLADDVLEMQMTAGIQSLSSWDGSYADWPGTHEDYDGRTNRFYASENFRAKEESFGERTGVLDGLTEQDLGFLKNGDPGTHYVIEDYKSWKNAHKALTRSDAPITLRSLLQEADEGDVTAQKLITSLHNLNMPDIEKTLQFSHATKAGRDSASTFIQGEISSFDYSLFTTPGQALNVLGSQDKVTGATVMGAEGDVQTKLHKYLTTPVGQLALIDGIQRGGIHWRGDEGEALGIDEIHNQIVAHGVKYLKAHGIPKPIQREFEDQVRMKTYKADESGIEPDPIEIGYEPDPITFENRHWTFDNPDYRKSYLDGVWRNTPLSPVEQSNVANTLSLRTAPPREAFKQHVPYKTGYFRFPWTPPAEVVRARALSLPATEEDSGLVMTDLHHMFSVVPFYEKIFSEVGRPMNQAVRVEKRVTPHRAHSSKQTTRFIRHVEPWAQGEKGGYIIGENSWATSYKDTAGAADEIINSLGALDLMRSLDLYKAYSEGAIGKSQFNQLSILQKGLRSMTPKEAMASLETGFDKLLPSEVPPPGIGDAGVPSIDSDLEPPSIDESEQSGFKRNRQLADINEERDRVERLPVGEIVRVGDGKWTAYSQKNQDDDLAEIAKKTARIELGIELLNSGMRERFGNAVADWFMSVGTDTPDATTTRFIGRLGNISSRSALTGETEDTLKGATETTALAAQFKRLSSIKNWEDLNRRLPTLLVESQYAKLEQQRTPVTSQLALPDRAAFDEVMSTDGKQLATELSYLTNDLLTKKANNSDLAVHDFPMKYQTLPGIAHLVDKMSLESNSTAMYAYRLALLMWAADREAGGSRAYAN